MYDDDADNADDDDAEDDDYDEEELAGHNVHCTCTCTWVTSNHSSSQSALLLLQLVEVALRKSLGLEFLIEKALSFQVTDITCHNLFSP